ncbi:DUF742 domain-containing protein [Streptomyces sp. NPDC060194]|uniref:DUF742 domain-containing protein n=1 Tax=Streptomyces sp. NPDC060194 TaxID=3347069 RepID=UPI00365C8D81
MTSPPRRERREPLPEEDPDSDPDRLYLLTGGAPGGRAPIDLVTMIVGRPVDPDTLQPEQAAIVRLCSSPLSVAEVSAYLRLPFRVVAVILTGLLDADLVESRAPLVRKALPDRALLEAVMHGLQKL